MAPDWMPSVVTQPTPSVPPLNLRMTTRRNLGSAAGYLFASLYFLLPLTRLYSNKTGDRVKHGMVGVLCMSELAEERQKWQNFKPVKPGFSAAKNPGFRG